jgi:putative ABC transport system permease protein
MIASFSLMMGASSLFALFIGMFIIYNAFAIAVTQRRSEIGVLRALGASREQIRWLFLGEGLLMGIIGSATGLMLGLLFARGITASVSTVVADAFGVAHQGEDISIGAAMIGWAAGIGILTSVVAAFLPARAAARVDPIQALQKGAYHVVPLEERRTRIWLAALCALAAGSLWLSSTRLAFYASYLLVIVGVLLLAPMLSLVLARVLRPVLKWARPVEGALAADSLIQSPRRTSSTVSALMLSVALVVAFAGMARASLGSILEWMDTVVNPDLFVMPAPTIVMRTLRFPGTMGKELAAVQGVGRIQAVREAHVVFRRQPVLLLAADLVSIQETTQTRVVAGDPAEMYRTGAAGKGLLVSESLAELHGLEHGETIELGTPRGVLALPVAGIVVDYSDQKGSILIDQTVFERYWSDDSVTFFRVYTADGANVGETRERILERFAGKRQVFVLNNDDLRAYILRITNQWFQLTYVQIGLAVVVAILGIVNTLTVSITDRRRELGVLRAVGALPRQIRWTIWIEAVATGIIGLALGLLLGAVNLYYVLDIVRRDVAGMRLDYEFPVMMMTLVVPVILLAALLAALVPAETAVRGPLVEALEYE